MSKNYKGGFDHNQKSEGLKGLSDNPRQFVYTSLPSAREV